MFSPEYLQQGLESLSFGLSFRPTTRSVFSSLSFSPLFINCPFDFFLVTWFEYIVATDLAARGIDIEGVSHVINDAIPQDLSFFVHRVGRTGRNGLPGVAITLYQPSDDSDIRELEKMGIRFVPKVLKNGVIEDTYDRDRRANREKKQEKLDIEMIGLVKKKKKKIKPGYKKKIKWAVDEKRRKAKRAENRARGRAERKAKRQTF